MAKGDVHVVLRKTGWRVEIEGTARAQSTHDTQGQACETAREIAKRGGRDLLVHGRNGQIRQRNTYGKDPHETEG